MTHSRQRKPKQQRHAAQAPLSSRSTHHLQTPSSSPTTPLQSQSRHCHARTTVQLYAPLLLALIIVIVSHSITEAWAPPRRIRAIWNRHLVMKPIPPANWNHNCMGGSGPAVTTRLSVLAERPTDVSGGNGFDKNKNRKKNRRKPNQKRTDDEEMASASTTSSNAAATSLDAEVEVDVSADADAITDMGRNVADRAEREYKLIREEENLKLFFERHEPLPLTESPFITPPNISVPRASRGIVNGLPKTSSKETKSRVNGLVPPTTQSNNNNNKRRNNNNNDTKSTTTTNNTSDMPRKGRTARRKNNRRSQMQTSKSENNNNDKGQEESQGFKIPQIHLPMRLVSRIGWEHHRQAATSFMHQHFGGDGDKNDDDQGKVNGATARTNTGRRDDDEEGDPEIFHVAVDASVSDDIPTFIATHKKKNPMLVSSTNEWKRLEAHAHSEINRMHLRDMLQDTERCNKMFAEHDGVYLDFSRQRANLKTMQLLQDLAKKQKLDERIRDMMTGKKINFTEKRAVLHTALRADRDHEPIMVDGVNVVEEVHEVLDQIKAFTEGVRAGTIRGHTGKRLRNIISVGIGGSYLGPEFLHEVLKTEPEGVHSALGYTLRFLANVDPVDVERTCADLDPEETLVIVVSKTFTTAETMLNARIMRQWLWDFMGDDPGVVQKHVVACASVSATHHVEEFGIDTQNYFFKFWDWVGGRYSVCSAAGAVPISLLYGFDVFEKFLKGANSIDEHFMSAPFDRNIPVIMGMLGVWNMSFMKYKTRTTLPYAEALLKLPAHIQQLDMESNGKVMTRHGVEADYPVGEIDFGEPGTNGQHSFFQLLHMGQTCPCDFIGFCQSQHDLCLDDETLSSHDELMANFFAQPDALAYGKTADQVRAEGVEEDLVPHRTFKGNRPSMSLLLPKLTAYATGQLLAIYEHRTTVQGFIWDINSFDQWGVELGKKLAIDVKDHLLKARQLDQEGQMDDPIDAGNAASSRILNYYVHNSQPNLMDDTDHPLTRVTRKTHADHHRTSEVEQLEDEL